MTEKEVLKELEAAGTAQNRKIYGRHGIEDPMFGVSRANLEKLRKRIKTDHALAQTLWASGNHDARILATTIANPAAMQAQEVDAWAKDLGNYVLTDAFSKLVGQTPFAQKRAEKWIVAKNEWIGRAGWKLLGGLAMDKENDLPDDYFEHYLKCIEAEIHTRKNLTRDAMNTALICIGIRNKNLEKKALAAAKHIGVVEVDHGETSCKTPDAAEYIQKTLAWGARKKK